MATAWQEHVESLPVPMRAEAQAWYDSLPEPARVWAERCPPGTPVEIGGRTAYATAYSGLGISFSYVDPGRDYEGAVASRFLVCGSHFDDNGKIAVPDGAKLVPGGLWG